MRQANRQARLLRVTALSAALMGVYGVGVAQTDTVNTLKCAATGCTPPTWENGDKFFDSRIVSSGDYGWVVKGESATFTLTGGEVKAIGHRLRAVGAVNAVGSEVGSHVTLNDVDVITESADATRWGNHGVVANGLGSIVEINGGSITTTGEYNNGIQAENQGFVTGSDDVAITVTGGPGKYTYGVEAGDGGQVELIGGSITVSGGNGAAGVRAYTGFDSSGGIKPGGRGSVLLNGTIVEASGSTVVGLLAGDTEGGTNPSAGNIRIEGGASVTSQNSDAARVRFGSQLEVDGSTLKSLNAKGLVVDGSDSGATPSIATLTNAQVTGKTHGAHILAGGKLVAGNSSIIATADSGNVTQGGLVVEGSGSTATLTDTNVTGNKRGIAASNSGTVSLTNGIVKTVVVSNNNASTVHVAGGASLTANDTQFIVEADGLGTGSLSNVIWADGLGTTVDLTGGSVSANNEVYGRGLLATKSASITGREVEISTSGGKSNAVHAFSNFTTTGDSTDKPSIELNGGSVTTTGLESYGLFAQNNGSTISASDLTVTTDKDQSYGVVAYNGGQVDLTNVDIETSGIHARGISVGETSAGQTPGSVQTPNVGSSVSMIGGSITTHNTTGKETQDGDGSRAYAVYVKGAGSSADLTDVTILTEGQRAYGAHAIGGGNVELTGGSVTTNGFMAYGVYASGAGSTVTTNNVDITTHGQVGDAIWAYQGGVTTINGGTILVHGDPNPNSPHESGNGIVAAGGAAGVGNGVVNVNNASITTMGRDSVGALAGALIGATSTSGTINLNNTQLEVQGAGAVGASVENGSTLTASNGTRIASLQGNGIDFVNSGTATLTGTTVAAAGDAFHSTFTTAGQTQNITLGANSTVSSGNGNLLYVQRKTDGSDGVVNLTLQNGSHASGNIRNYDADGNLVARADTFTTVNVQDGAIWAGIFIDKGTSVVDGDDDMDDFTTGEGEDVAIDGTGSGTQNFNGTTNIGGSVSVGRDVSFNGPTTIGNDLNGQDGTSTSIQGPATIGGSVVGGAGSSFAFNSTTSIGGSVAGAGGSDFSFNGDTNIGGGVSGQGGASFSFSQTGSSSIGGDVNLGGGSSIGGGSMNNPINVGGNAVVGAGSTLGGNLNVAGSLSGSGGTFAPGNSIGSQTYGSMGSFTGTYVAEVNSAGLSDLVTITSGNADLTGIDLKVSQENGNGGYKLYHDYTIVKTGKADGISAVAGNKFASEALDDTFAGTLVKLDPAKFGANDVKVSLSVDGDAIDRTGLSSNQSATLDGALSVAGQNASADAVMFMQPDARKDALNQLSGELHGSTQAALLQTSSLVSRTLSARMRGNLGAGMQPGAPTAQAGGAVAGSMPTSAAYPLWAQVVGNWNTLDSDGNAAKVKTNTAGLFIGGDTDVGSGWRVGGALGYTDGRVKVDDRDSRSDVGTFTAALYGGNSWDQGSGKLNFLAGAAYSHHSIDTRRSVNVGGNQTLKADYSAHTTQLFTELGYAMPVGERSVVEPYVGLAWLSQKARGFTEEGGAAALSADSQKDDVTTFTLGLRGKTALNVGSNPAHLFAGLGWRHASGDVDPGRSVSFVQGGGAAFNVAGAPIAKNAAVFDLGVEMSVGRNTAMGLGYSGQYGNDNTDHSGQLYLRARF
ncbi:outer membrane autotransporter protein [Pusillimonas noertemannii]|uniref:Outer membrane autotransporter protein n=1 Tax=Pusillimonas noertemannii TaxID=305977 RepID=A0A2U1CHH5_9BURK|nr:outer membrane autotransporter protein [Pusillimonas noertemannii]